MLRGERHRVGRDDLALVVEEHDAGLRLFLDALLAAVLGAERLVDHAVVTVRHDDGLVLGHLEQQAARLDAVLAVRFAGVQGVEGLDALVELAGGHDLVGIVLAADDGRIAAELVAQLLDDVVDTVVGLGGHDDTTHGVAGNGDLVHILSVSSNTTSIRFVTHYV